MIVPETITLYEWQDDVPREVPFHWDGEVHEQARMQAFIVDVKDRRAHFVITHYDNPEDDRFKWHGSSDGYDTQTATIWAGWASQYPNYPKVLREVANSRYSGEVPDENHLDSIYLEEDAPEIVPGDTVHIHQLLLWGDVLPEDNTHAIKLGHTIYELCKMPMANEEVGVFFERTARMRPRIAAQLVRTSAKREMLDMQSYPRIHPNTTARPFEDTASCLIGRERHGRHDEIFRSRNVYGAGVVKDHYLDVTARVAGEYYTDAGGIQRFTDKGGHLFVPNIVPFGSLSEDDPLYVVEIKLWSSSVICPALAEQKVFVTIDGIRYEALQDPEDSSTSFDKPGRRITFNGLRRVGQEYDMFELTEEQSQALFDRTTQEFNVGRSVMMEIIERDGSLWGVELQEINNEIGRRIKQMRAEAEAQNRVIEGIIGVEPKYKNPQGGALLLPKSMLDALEIELPAVSE